jgi:DNA invertase Pin-like site-specific DNA recombinase
MARIGYARVSSIDQDLEGQLERLKGEGCGVIRSEKVSGASRDGRPELETIIEFLRAGDELLVTRLDLGRDTRDVLNLIHEAEQKGAFVSVLDPANF